MNNNTIELKIDYMALENANRKLKECYERIADFESIKAALANENAELKRKLELQANEINPRVQPT